MTSIVVGESASCLAVNRALTVAGVAPARAQDAVKGDRTGEGVDEFAHLVPVQIGQPEVVVAEHDRMRHIRQAGGVSQGFDSLRG